MSNNHGIIYITIRSQGTEEQANFWIPKLMRFEVTGAYAQTELGHGSNVRGIHTTATYDPVKEEFILNTPTLRSIKWWPGALGKVATHVVLYAQLVLNGKEHGIHVFIMQIRDENHLPLPGVTLGDIGNKMGDNANDAGFIIIQNVRIPRENMLAKYNRITKDGKLEAVQKVDLKVTYFTMISTRVTMIIVSAARLAQASTIAIRYSAVRTQGFVDNSQGVSYNSRENHIIDYRIQLYRLLKQLSVSFALKFTGEWIKDQITMVVGKFGELVNAEGLKELSASSAGLKSMITNICCQGIEDLRKCCGGNGYLLSSGISQLLLEWLVSVTAEGDYIILALSTACSLLSAVGSVMSGKQVKGVIEYLNVVANVGFKVESVYPKDCPNKFFNIKYLEEMFKFRAIKRCMEVAQDFNLEVSQGKQFQEAFNLCANDLFNTSNSHCYYIIMKNFVEKANAVKDESIRRVLTRLVIMFACSNFLDDSWGDIIEKSEYREIKKTLNKVMEEVRPDCVALVDAFDFSDQSLKSAIGRYDGNVYEALLDSAKKSILNQQDPFEGYEEYLKPHLNKDLLKRGNKPISGFGKF